MEICFKKTCDCYVSRAMYFMRKGLNDEAKSRIQSFENFSELADPSGRTLLHCAVEYRNPKMVQYLLDEGCQVNAQDNFGVSPLMLAIEGSDINIVGILLKNNADIYNANNDRGILELSFCVLMNLPRTVVIHAYRNEYRVLEMLFDKVNDDFSKGKLDQWLLSENDSVKLVIIVAFGNEQITRFMLKNGYPIDFKESQYGYTAIHCSIRFGRFDNVKILIEHGACVDSLDKKGRSPLQDYTSKFEDNDENSEILKLLLRSSRHLLTPNRSCHASVQWLLKNGNKKTVKTLLSSGIDVEACLPEGKTLMSCIVENRNEDIFEVFDELDIRLDVNQRDSTGMTVLVDAIKLGFSKKVEFLLEHGADMTNLITSNKETALAFININLNWGTQDVRMEGTKIVELLLQFGSLDAQSLFNSINYKSDNFSPANRMIVAHLALIEAQDRSSLTSKSRNKIVSDAQSKAYFDLCTKQIEEMKAAELHGTVNLVKLLTEKDEQIAAYARNQELISALNRSLENSSHLELYYVNLARRKLSRGQDLAKLHDKVALVIESLTGICTDVYHVIVYKIISYLHRQDLKNLCKI